MVDRAHGASWPADEESRVRKLGRRSGTGQLAGSNFVLDALVEGETVAEVLENAQHQVWLGPLPAMWGLQSIDLLEQASRSISTKKSRAAHRGQALLILRYVMAYCLSRHQTALDRN